jgi:hypothetical protein
MDVTVTRFPVLEPLIETLINFGDPLASLSPDFRAVLELSCSRTNELLASSKNST